jgi:hypothetical protein
MASAAIAIGSAAVGGFLQYKGQKQMIQAQQRAERLRERQMNLQAMRERREVVRNSILARATALATTSAQGASAPGSSALGGAYGQIGGDRGRQTLAINQNQEIGQGIFKANRQYFSGTQTQGMGSAVSGFGQAVSSSINNSSFANKKIMGVPVA